MTYGDARRPPRSSPPPATAVAARAGRQHGVIHRGQLVAEGVGPRAIGRWAESGRLHRLHPLVYAVGHTALPPLGPTMAAVLAGSHWDPRTKRFSGAAAGLHSAASMLELIDPWEGTPQLVTVRRPRLAGVDVHTVRSLHRDDVVIRERMPITTWARTLLDLATVLPLRWLIRALERSVVRNLYEHWQLMTTMDRANGHHGIGPLRQALATGHHLNPQTTRSLLEDLFLFLMREAVPPVIVPEMNGRVRLSAGERFEIDALWRALKVAIELDSRWHDPSGARLRDRARDDALKRDGYLTYRFRWADVTGRPGWVLYIVRDLLDRAARRALA